MQSVERQIQHTNGSYICNIAIFDIPVNKASLNGIESRSDGLNKTGRQMKRVSLKILKSLMLLEVFLSAFMTKNDTEFRFSSLSKILQYLLNQAGYSNGEKLIFILIIFEGKKTPYL